MLRLAVGVLVGGVAFAGIGWAGFRTMFVRPGPYLPVEAVDPALSGPLLSWDEHDRVYQTAPDPLVLRLAPRGGRVEETGVATPGTPGGELMYVGIGHTQDAAAPALKEIERLWDEFRPTVALCEGRTRRFIWMSRPASGAFTESDLVFVLARRAGIPCLSLEPSFEVEVRSLLDHHPKEEVAAYVVLRGVLSESRGKSVARDELAFELLGKRTSIPELRGAITDIAGLDAVWQKNCPGGPDWRVLDGFPDGSCFGAIGDESRAVRGRHMMRSLSELARRGERVFAVVGRSHVIRQEARLRAAMDDRAARAQPGQ